MERLTNPNKSYCDWSHCSVSREVCHDEECDEFYLYNKLKYYEDLAEQGRLVELSHGKVVEIDCGDCELKEIPHQCYNCIRYIAACYVDKYEPKKERLAELEV